MKKADIKPNSVYYVSQGAYNMHSVRQNIKTGYILTGDTIEWQPQFGDEERAEEWKVKYGDRYQLAYLDPSNFTVVTPDHTAMAFLAIDDAKTVVDVIVEANPAGTEGYTDVRNALRTRFPKAMGHSSITADRLVRRIHVKQVEREIDQDAYWAKAQADADAAAQRVIDKAAQKVAYGHYRKWADAEYRANVMPVVQEALRGIPHGFMAVCKDTRYGGSLQNKIDESIIDGDFDALHREWGVNLTDGDGDNPSVTFGRGMGSNGSEVEIGMSFSTMLAMAAAWKTVYGDRDADEVVAEFAPTFDLTRLPAEARA